VFKIEVLTTPDGRTYKWKFLRPTGGKPYEFKTEKEAKDMIKWLYPFADENTVRVAN
jgi:CHASE1-domain containing sensor protein